MSAGFGSCPQTIGQKLTWRQMQHFAAALHRRKRLERADNMQSIAVAMGAKDLPAVLRELRR
jgi:hypothetical protein